MMIVVINDKLHLLYIVNNEFQKVPILSVNQLINSIHKSSIPGSSELLSTSPVKTYKITNITDMKTFLILSILMLTYQRVILTILKKYKNCPNRNYGGFHTDVLLYDSKTNYIIKRVII